MKTKRYLLVKLAFLLRRRYQMIERKVLYVGLDAGSSICHVAEISKEGEVVQDKTFATSQQNLIAAFKDRKEEIHVHLEASELAWWIRGILKDLVREVVVSHAKSNAWIAKDPLKSDKLDAHKLARLLRMGEVHNVYYSDDKGRVRFKQLIQHYDDLTEQAAELKVKIKSRFRAQGIIVTGVSVYNELGRVKWIAQLESHINKLIILQLYELMDAALTTKNKTRKLIEQESAKYKEVELFQEVPGVGLIAASKFSAYVQTPDRFSSKRKLWRYCRLGITDRSSDGKPLGRRRLDWNGNGRLKDTTRKIFQGAIRSKQGNALKKFYQESLKRCHNQTHARLSTQRKIVSVLRAMWKGGTRYIEDKG